MVKAREVRLIGKICGISLAAQLVCGVALAHNGESHGPSATSSAAVRRNRLSQSHSATSVFVGAQVAQSLTDSHESSSVPRAQPASYSLIDDATLSAWSEVPLLKHMNLSITAGYVRRSGLLDPTVGPSFTLPLSKRVTGRASLSAAAPLSSDSHNTSRITTLTAAAGPFVKVDRWMFTAQGAGSLHLYGGSHSHGVAPTVKPPVPAPVIAKEKVRVGGGASAAYRLERQVTLGSGVELNRIYRLNASGSWLTEATLAQVTYELRRFEGTLGFSLSREQSSLGLPTQPTVRLQLQYSVI